MTESIKGTNADQVVELPPGCVATGRHARSSRSRDKYLADFDEVVTRGEVDDG